MQDEMDGFKKYQQSVFDSRKELMKSLEAGQSPHTLFITCSDSRISVNEITSSNPGEIFVIRNAGNMIEPMNEKNPSQDAITLEYAVKQLGIINIVVCGHTHCAIMESLKNLDSLNHLPLLKKRLESIKEHYQADDFAVENISLQIKNLKTYPFTKGLKISGGIYDFVAGTYSVVE